MGTGEGHDTREDCADYSAKPIVEKAVRGVTVSEYWGLVDRYVDRKVVSDTDLQKLDAARSIPDHALRLVLSADRHRVTDDHIRRFQHFVEQGGTPDTVIQHYEAELVSACGDANHRLRQVVEAFRRGATEDEYWRLLMPILSDALGETADPLHFYALVIFVAPAYMSQIGEDIPFLRSRNFGEIVERNSVPMALKTAYARRAEEKVRYNSRRASKAPRSKRNVELRERVINDMRVNGHRHDRKFKEWLKNALGRGAGDDFEINDDGNGGFLITGRGRDLTILPAMKVRELTMSTDWWQEARE